MTLHQTISIIQFLQVCHEWGRFQMPTLSIKKSLVNGHPICNNNQLITNIPPQKPEKAVHHT